MTALAQVGGRLHALYAFWLVAGIRPDRAAIMPALVMAGAWTVAELVRYPHYIASQLVALTGRSATPRWLEWLRYSAFIPLYPIGLIGESTLHQLICHATSIPLHTRTHNHTHTHTHAMGEHTRLAVIQFSVW